MEEGLIPVHETHEKFPVSPPYTDVPWAILFGAQFFLMVFAAVFFYQKNSTTLYIHSQFPTILLANILPAALFAFLSLRIVTKYVHSIILVALTSGSVALGVLVGIFWFAGSPLLSVIMLISLIFSIRYTMLIKDRIPFTVALLEIVIDITKNFPSLYILSLLSVLLQILWNVLWIFAAVYLSSEWSYSALHKLTVVFLYIFLIFSFYWTSQVVWNTLLVAIDGVFAEWFFRYPNAMSPNPISRSLQRATTTSFGSICVGSFINSLFKTLRYLLEKLKASDRGCVMQIAGCLTRCLEGVVEYLNSYAFTYVSIYGLGYCDAAKSVWHLLDRRGFDIIINDDLIGGVIVVASIVSGVCVGVLDYVVCGWILKIDLDELFVCLGVFVGFVMSYSSLRVLQSGADTLLVCYAEDPTALQQTKSISYDKLTNAFHMRYSGRVPMFTFKF